MNKTALKRIFRCFFRFILGVIVIFAVGVVSLSIVFFLPYDFEMNHENKTLYDYSMNNMRVDKDIVAYKKVYTKLYVKGYSGFWIIDLKKKNFKLLNTQLGAMDLNQDKSKMVSDSIPYKKKEYGDRMTILDGLDQLSSQEQKIYEDLNNSSQGEGIVYTKEHLRSNYYGPYHQPLEYLFN
ncbi:MAG: hypothetical protein H6Q70_384 [Firmicutes bacterium]|nr:hypothetical protein [Bacillota bacterium]